MNQYKIESITDSNGITREDGRYPLRIGSTVSISMLEIGKCMYLEYIKDKQGNRKDGCLRTSLVNKHDYAENNNLLIVETCNSIYYLKETNIE